MNHKEFLGVDLPIIQAPMAGVQNSALTLAVSGAGGLGSLPCAMLAVKDIEAELTAITAQTNKPFNLNFFCHTPPRVSAERETRWRQELAPYFREFGIEPESIPAAAMREPFNEEIAAVIASFKPSIVSFHFGLPQPHLLQLVNPGEPKCFLPPLLWKKPDGWKPMGPTVLSRRAWKQVVIAACF